MKHNYIKSLVADSLKVYSITALADNAIAFWLNQKTICLASLGIATVDKAVMKEVVEEIRSRGFFIKEMKLSSVSHPLWSGSKESTYYAISQPQKIAYYAKTSLPENGHKQVAFLGQQDNSLFTSGDNGSVQIKESELDLTELVACHVLVPNGSYLWIDKTGEVYYSESVEPSQRKFIKPEKYVP